MSTQNSGENSGKRGRPENLRPWPRGTSGNAGGRPKKTPLTDACREVLAQAIPGDPEGRTYAQKIAAMLAEKATEGDIRAAQELADRAEGRARQTVEIENTALRQAFERMSEAELDAYAREGSCLRGFPSRMEKTMEKTVKLSSSEPQAALRPEDFPLGSLESRVAVRAMLDARRAGGYQVHISVVGHPRPCLLCTCDDCRRWWEAHPEERAEEESEHQKFLDSFKTAPVQRQERQMQEQQAVDAADRDIQASTGGNAVGYLSGQGYASATLETARRRFPQTRTGRAMAFLRGGGSR